MIGRQSFDYALYFGDGEYMQLPNKAAKIFAPLACAGIGGGNIDRAGMGGLFDYCD